MIVGAEVDTGLVSFNWNKMTYWFKDKVLVQRLLN
jgi:hypothetical protein